MFTKLNSLMKEIREMAVDTNSNGASYSNSTEFPERTINAKRNNSQID
jgi:hypothetical protein